MSDELVKRLRDRNSPVLDEDTHEAADRIEELEALVRDIDKVVLFDGVPDGTELQARIDLALGYATSGEQEQG